MQTLITGAVYRHYKGKLYRVHALVKHSETLEELAFYECLYDSPGGRYWVRPVAMFLGDVTVDGCRQARFTRVEASGPQYGGGHAPAEQHGERGWFVGHFLDAEAGLRFTGDVEVKWSLHSADSSRAKWSACRSATSLSILVSGQFRVLFKDGDVLLERPGDYVFWAPQVPHSWRSEVDATIVTVRWPSRADDCYDVAVT